MDTDEAGWMPAGSDGSDGGADGSADEPTKFDVAAPTTTGGATTDRCKVGGDIDAVGVCGAAAPPDSFEPVVQWSFSLPYYVSSVSTPLVANMTDDNGDGAIDLCDIPDVVTVIGGTLHVFSGDDGALHFKDETGSYVDSRNTPAIGDIDGDGLPEIVTLDAEGVVAFDHDGIRKWHLPIDYSAGPGDPDWGDGTAMAIANLDNAGLPEIYFGNRIVSDDGSSILTLPYDATAYSATVAADLDDDGDLEVILGPAAFHHDGTPLWTTDLPRGYPQVADLDADGRPEVLLTCDDGLALIEHDGSVTYSGLRPTGTSGGPFVWRRPATIHDFDGDGRPEIATATPTEYSVFETDGTLLWSAPIEDLSGAAAGTAFDFLGDGVAEAMYTDEFAFYLFDEHGNTMLHIPRNSWTILEYPVVADVDNDGSAEIIVVSDHNWEAAEAPVLQVIADAEDRWIQARRIYNQHTYHVTNVREDGTIPQFEQPHWRSINTFRSNAQIDDDGPCMPPAG